jgi:hypothetical protein
MVDLRKPHRDWRKHPPSLTALTALLSLGLFVAGFAVSFAPGAGGNASDTIADVLFIAGAVVAGLFIVVYVLRLGDTDPRKRHFKSD